VPRRARPPRTRPWRAAAVTDRWRWWARPCRGVTVAPEHRGGRPGPSSGSGARPPGQAGLCHDLRRSFRGRPGGRGPPDVASAYPGPSCRGAAGPAQAGVQTPDALRAPGGARGRQDGLFQAVRLPEGERRRDDRPCPLDPGRQARLEIRVLGTKGEIAAKSKIAGTVRRDRTAVLRAEERAGSRKPLRLEWDAPRDRRRTVSQLLTL